MAEHIPRTVIWGDGGGSTMAATARAIHEGAVNFEIVGVIAAHPNANIFDQVEYANRNYGMDIEPFVAPGQPGRKQPEAVQRSVLEFLQRHNTSNLVLMGSLVIMGEMLVEELNGDVPEVKLPRTTEQARALMVAREGRRGFFLPDSFPQIALSTERYGLLNTHPAPTIVTANTHGEASQLRMVELEAAESAVTFHAVALGVDTGPILAAHTFPTEPVDPLASEDEKKAAAAELFKRAQKIEKIHLPLDVEAHLLNRLDHSIQ